jgi:hypothetical protein
MTADGASSRWLRYAGLALAGTGLRLWVAWAVQTWHRSPDLLAWGALLMEGPGLGLDRLLHYPHEGGSIIVSLVAMGLARAGLDLVPPLVGSALLLDTVSRVGACLVVDRLFGPGKALWFGAWTVCAVPLVLWWSAVPVGLHHLAGVFPLAFILAASSTTGDRASRMGLVCGLSLLWAWDNLVLLVAVVPILYDRLDVRASLARLLVFFVWSAGIASLLFLVRSAGSTGFELEPRGPFWLRGVELTGLDPMTAIAGLATTAVVSLPAALALGPLLGWLWWTCWALLAAGNRDEKSGNPMAVRAAGWVIATYVLAYSVSPFRSAIWDINVIAYRHLTYIVALVVVVAIARAGRQSRRGRLAFAGLLALGVAGSAGLLSMPEASIDPARAGWVLARKLGHDPRRLERLVEGRPLSERPEWMEGIGWGTTAIVLGPSSAAPEAERSSRVTALLSQYAAEHRAALQRGVCRAFAPGVTPRLDRQHLSALQAAGFAPTDCATEPARGD